MTGTTRLVLLRHGATEWNLAGRLQGNADIGLSETGRDQARAVRPLLDPWAVDRVVRSPLLRCAQTADEIGVDGLPSLDDPEVRVDARWAEADLGEWTGRTREELIDRGDRAYDAWRAGSLVPPGGESLEDIRARVDDALTELRGRAGTTLVVTHGGPIRAVLHLLLGLRTGQVVPVSPAGLTVVDLSLGRPRLAAYNLTAAATGAAHAAALTSAGASSSAETTD